MLLLGPRFSGLHPSLLRLEASQVKTWGWIRVFAISFLMTSLCLAVHTFEAACPVRNLDGRESPLGRTNDAHFRTPLLEAKPVQAACEPCGQSRRKPETIPMPGSRFLGTRVPTAWKFQAEERSGSRNHLG